MLAPSETPRPREGEAWLSAWRDARTWRPYAIALAAVAFALVLRWAATPWLGDRFPFLFLVGAVVLAAWLGGLGPGLLAANASTVLLVLGPHAADLRVDESTSSVFLLIGLGISLLGAALHGARERERIAVEAFDAAQREHADHARTVRVLETITDGFIALGRAGDISFVNTAAEHMARRPRASLLGRHYGEAFPNFDGDDVRDALHRVVTAGVTVSLDHRHAPTDQWFHLKAHPAPDGGISLHFRDITHERQREKELADSRLLLQRMAEATPDLLYRHDVVKDRNVYVNLAVADVLGYPRDHLEGAWREDWDALVHPDDRAMLQHERERILALPDGEVLTYEYRVRHADGTDRWLRHRVTVFTRDAQGRATEVLGLAQDVTSFKEAEAVLTRANETLEAEVRRRTRELSALSRHLMTLRERERATLARELHDELGDALTTLKLELHGALEASGASDADIRTRHERMDRTVDDAVRIKRRLLHNLRPTMVDTVGLSTTLGWQVDDAKSRGVDGSMAIEGDVDALDEARANAVYRIVQEALGNVLQHARAGRFAIELGRDASTVTLAVRDDGVGLDATPRNPSGLGLATMRERALQLAGSFDLESGLDGRGTAVRVRFPAADPAPPRPPASDAAV